MGREPHYDAQQRDAALARMMKQEHGTTTLNSACPDAEVLAAFTEQGLEPAEMGRCEEHIASCTRCRRIVAMLAVSGGATSATEAPTAAADGMAEPAVAIPTVRPIRRRAWLVPALSAAAVVALWFALRPAWLTRPAQTIAQIPAAESAVEETQIAQANLPREQPSPSPVPQDRAEPQPGSQAEKSPQSFTTDTVAPAAPAPKAQEAPQAQAASNASGDVPQARERAAAEALSAAATPVAPAPPATAEAVTRDQGAEGRSTALFAGRQVAALTLAPQGVFAAPGQAATWRVGAAGRIEHSTDQGRTWQQQTSGVTSDLIAGSAPSPQVAWIAGRNGTILRTTDGASWERVAPPTSAASTDWASIEATDAQHATIVSRDSQRFRTEDGGRTWSQQ
jgi:hypothetical protein